MRVRMTIAMTSAVLAGTLTVGWGGLVGAAGIPSINLSQIWAAPNRALGKPGLTTIKSPPVPSAHEESVFVPGSRGSVLNVASGAPRTGGANGTPDGTRQVAIRDGVFHVNGAAYTLPKPLAHGPALVLPLASGIVWTGGVGAAMLPVKQALRGSTPIYYTPYRLHGGSLLAGARRIAVVPHAWYGPDGPAIAAAWSGWLPASMVRAAHVAMFAAHLLRLNDKSRVLANWVLDGPVPGWPTLNMTSMAKKRYTAVPHYAASIQSLSRIGSGFILTVALRPNWPPGRNAGVSTVNYYWSSQTGQWTPLNQNYSVQTLSASTSVGSGAAYWMQPLPISAHPNQRKRQIDPTLRWGSFASFTWRTSVPGMS